MLRIRLARVGKKKRPAYRMVVADSRAPRDGAFLEIIGHYDPLPDPARVTIDEERAVHWLKVGAQPSDTAAKLLSKAGVMEKAGLKPVVSAPAQPTTPDKAKARAKAKATTSSPEAGKAESQPAEAETSEAETRQEPNPAATE